MKRNIASAVRVLGAGLLGITISWTLAAVPARAADPVKVGFSMALTGAVAPNGKQILIALEIWRDDLNGKGGLLGRPVELVYYDDQSNPSNVPGIYTKLISVDKVDLLLGPYATNMAAAAMPAIMQNNKTYDLDAGDRREQSLQLPEIFLDGAGRARRREGVLAWFLRTGGGAEAEAENGGDPRR